MDLKLHNKLRKKAQKVYTEIPTQGIYYNSRSVMEFSYKDSKEDIKKSYIDPMSSAVIVNALVPKSGVLFKGGHGGGKTSLVEKVSHMLTDISEKEISAAMIRGNDYQNVNTLLASLQLGKLMAKGEEVVRWRKFVTSYVKIIDELNRFPPPAQNALFEILNRGRVEFLDKEYEINDFMVCATENPNDAGTYPLSKPFVDRFSFCVPAPQLPGAEDQYLLAERPDDKLVDLKVKSVMTFEELKTAQKLISQDVALSSDAILYAIYLTQAISTCERGDYSDKSHNILQVGERCKGCGYDTDAAVCKMTMQGVSGRAFLDLQRWSKAYAWFLGAFTNPENPRVELDILQTIAPYILYHRVEPNQLFIGRDPYNGSQITFLEQIIEKATNGYNVIKDALKEVPKVLRGELSLDKAEIRKIEKDLVVQYHFKPLVEEAAKKSFRGVYNFIKKNEMSPENIQKLQQDISFGTELKQPAQKYLLSKALAKARKEEHL